MFRIRFRSLLRSLASRFAPVPVPEKDPFPLAACTAYIDRMEVI